LDVCDLDMRQHFVIDPLISKRQQLLLATQLCRMVLKVCLTAPFL
jgi:T-complex protein 1 subunit epsilon